MTQPTLQECLEWLSKEPDVCDWFEHYEGKPQNEIINAIRAQLEAGAARQWQSIETAPKDNTRIRLWNGLEHIGSWLNGQWVLDRGISFNFMNSPEATHWMPLPEPPEALTQATASGLIAEGK